MSELPPGYLLGTDEPVLANLAKQVPDGGTILEIGTASGRSISILRDNSKNAKLYTIDIQDKIDIPGVTCIEGDSKKVEWDKPIDLLWIDGNHTDEYVKNDIERFSPFVKPGGIICGHDYTGSNCTVWRYVNQLIKDSPDYDDFRIESEHIWIARKK